MHDGPVSSSAHRVSLSPLACGVGGWQGMSLLYGSCAPLPGSRSWLAAGQWSRSCRCCRQAGIPSSRLPHSPSQHDSAHGRSFVRRVHNQEHDFLFENCWLRFAPTSAVDTWGGKHMSPIATGGGSSAVAASSHASCERFRYTDPMATGRSRRQVAEICGNPDTSAGIPEARWMRAMTLERLVRGRRCRMS